MIRISSIFYSVIFWLTIMLCQDVFLLALPEAAATAMVLTIAIYILMSWNYLHYVYTSFHESIDYTLVESPTFNKVLTLVLFFLSSSILTVLTYFMTRAMSEAPDLAIGACFILIFIANYRTTAYKEYSALNARRQASGLKSV